MKSLLIISAIIILFVLAIYFAKRLVDSIVNLYYAKNKKEYEHGGMVYNKKTKKLEADNSKILPFK